MYTHVQWLWSQCTLNGISCTWNDVSMTQFLLSDGNCLEHLPRKFGWPKFLIRFIKGNDNLFQKVNAHCKEMKYLGNWGTQVKINTSATFCWKQKFTFSKEPGPNSQSASSQPYTVDQCIKIIIQPSPPKGYHIEFSYLFDWLSSPLQFMAISKEFQKNNS